MLGSRRRWAWLQQTANLRPEHLGVAEVVSDRISPVFAVPLLHVVALVLQLASLNVQCSWRTARTIESLEPPGVRFSVEHSLRDTAPMLAYSWLLPSVQGLRDKILRDQSS